MKMLICLIESKDIVNNVKDSVINDVNSSSTTHLQCSEIFNTSIILNIIAVCLF